MAEALQILSTLQMKVETAGSTRWFAAACASATWTQEMITRSLPIIFALTLLYPAAAAPEKRIVDGVTYQILRAPADSVRIVWKDSEGRQLRTFPEAVRHLERNGATVDTLMNGGIFEPGGVPSGLLIQDGKQLTGVNRNEGEGNFFLKPNGIFLVGSRGAAVIRTDEYPLKDVEVRQAVQSGPLLLRHGKVHPAFNASSSSRLHRNGVGVSKDGIVVFAMTDFHSPKFPNLHEFAQLFQTLGCEDALFLDGDLSQMRSGADLAKPSNRFGSMIAVIKTAAVEVAPKQPATGPEPE
jgi:uncharacterized protein YigE (DUF2233 family)